MDAPSRRPRKDDAERGPLGAWTYRNIKALGLSFAQVSAATGYSEPTIRNLAGSGRSSARMLNAVYDYFREAGQSRTPPVAVDPPPGLNTNGPLPRDGEGAGLLALAQAISEMAAQLKAMLDRVDLDRVEENSARLTALEAQIASVWRAIHPDLEEAVAPSTPPAPRAKEG